MAYPKIFMAGMGIEKPISKSGCGSSILDGERGIAR